MRSTFITSALTIALSLTATIIPATGQPIATPTATQQQTSEIDREISTLDNEKVRTPLE